MKRIVSLLLAALMAVTFFGCGGKKAKNTIEGDYQLKKIVIEGFTTGADDSQRSSYFDVTRYGDNLMVSMYMVIGDSRDLLMGYLSEEYITEDEEKYKFWIQSSTGDIFNSSWCYVYFHPENNEISVPFGPGGESGGKFLFYKE